MAMPWLTIGGVGAADSARLIEEIKAALGKLEHSIQAMLALDRSSKGQAHQLLRNDQMEILPMIALPDGSVASGVNVAITEIAGKPVPPCTISILQATFKNNCEPISRWALIISGSMIAERDVQASGEDAQWKFNERYVEGAIERGILGTYLTCLYDLARSLHIKLRDAHERAEDIAAQNMDLKDAWREDEAAQASPDTLAMIDSIRKQSKPQP